MFTTKPRPVPSKAALRVLYQLAYISSGTAVGVGVLCAEERRRRTQIVQRIADNAKRIRQHPRYVASAALAVREADGEGDGVEGGGWYGTEEVGIERRGSRKVRRRFGGSTKGDDGVRGKDLPSVVELEYAAMGAGKRMSSGKRKRLAKARTAESSSSSFEHQKLPLHRESNAQADPISQQVKHWSPQSGLVDVSARPPTDNSHRKNLKGVNRQRGASNDGSDPPPTPPAAASFTPAKTSRSILSLHRSEVLLDKGRIEQAIEHYVSCIRQTSQTIQGTPLFQRLWDAALENKLFSRCADLLRLHIDYGRVFYSRCQALIRACGDHDEYDVLLDLFFREHRIPADLDWLRVQGDTRVILTAACSTDDSLNGHFDVLYRSLADARRRTIDKQRCHLLLRVVWRSTKNLDTVLERLHPMKKQLEDIHDVDALGIVDSTMAEIYINAGRIDDALNTIARIHKTGPSSSLCIILAAFAFAKQHSWESFHQVLRIGESQSDFASSKNTKARGTLHNVVYVYSQHHSATQTWKFVTYLQDKLHYWPNGYANRVILEAFVAKKAISLIPKWLRALKIKGYTFRMDGKFAARLLSKYYHDHRPSHVLIMWFCRNLAHHCPSLDPNEFIALIKSSIGYDLGGGFERSAVWQRDHVEQRLDRLGNADGQVTSPGHKYSNRLYFNHPEADESSDAAEAGKDDVKSQGSASEHVVSTEGFVKTHDGSLQLVPSERKDECPREAGTSHTRSFNIRKGNSPPLPSDPVRRSDFGEALPDDETALEGLLTPASPKEHHRRHKIVEDMRVQLSRHEFAAVLELYEGCLDRIGVPITPHALVLAVRASLRLYGHDEHAQHIIGRAERAGMNVIGALAPVLIHKIQNLDAADRDNANKLLDTTVQYYKTCDAHGHGFVPGHHVGITAANMLITHGRPSFGVNLLHNILGSKWREKRSVEIVLMTVMVKGYIALNSIRDVMFWARQALKLDVRISPNFVRELKRGLKVMKSASRVDRAHLGRYTEMCQTRRSEQAHEAKILGKQLVATIARCMREETAVDVDNRAQLDQEFFGAPRRGPRKAAARKMTGEPGQEGSQEPEFQPGQSRTIGLTRRERMLQRNKERVAKSGRCDPNAGFGDVRSARHLEDVRWLRQYRAFLRRPIVLDDGRYAPYRYALRSESAPWRAKARRSREQLRARQERFWEEGEGEQREDSEEK